VAGIGVRLVGVRVPDACIANLSGNEICDAEQPSCMNAELLDGHPGVVRLSENPGSSGQGTQANFDTDPSSVTWGGCPKWGGPASSEPYTQLEFIFDTSDDDFRSGSELDVDIFDQSGNDIEHGVVHAVGDTKFDNDTEHAVTYTLHNTAISFTDIASIQLTFIPETITCVLGICSHDEWHAQTIDVYAVRASSNWQDTCMFLGQEPDSSHPEFVLNNDNRVQTLTKLNGCP